MGKRLRHRIIAFVVVIIASACLVEARKRTDPYKSILKVSLAYPLRKLKNFISLVSNTYRRRIRGVSPACRCPTRIGYGSLELIETLVNAISKRLFTSSLSNKNKNKGAQAKFEEINNAYEILSDEEKSKNYDLYDDVNSGPNFGGGNARDFGGYQHFTSGGAGHNRFTSKPDDWQGMGGEGKSQSFSFSFGGPSDGSSFGFDIRNLFSNLFGGDSSRGSKFDGVSGSWRFQFGGFQSSAGPRKSSAKNVKVVDSRVFEKEVYDNGLAWLLVSYGPLMALNSQQELVLEEIASSLEGALKVGKVNYDSNQSFCKNYGIYSRQAPRALVYSFSEDDKGYFVEFDGEWNSKRLKSFCQDNLPRISKRVNLDKFDVSIGAGGRLPRVMLLSTKKEAPIIWRAISGLYRKRLMMYHTQVHDVTAPAVKKLGVGALPALVGWLSNGEKHIIKAGITVKSLDSAVQELSLLLDEFEKNRKVSSTPVCIIGSHRSSNGRKKLESVLLMVSQKTMLRRQFPTSDSKDPVSYALLDAIKQQAFLVALGESGLKSVDKLLLAYKRQKGKYAVLKDWDTMEEVESFISSILSGDVQLNKTRRKPKLI